MSDCIFCKIIKGEIPSHKVYEDDDVYVLLDINPVSKGHSLVIPKEHYEKLGQIPEDLVAKIMKTVKKIAHATLTAEGYTGFNLVQNNDKTAGQLVPHVHFHIIPRKEGDGVVLDWKTGKYEVCEADKIAEKINIAQQ